MVVPKDVTLRKVVLGDKAICTLADDHQIYCSGENSRGQFGNPTVDADKSTKNDEYVSPDPTTLALFGVKGFSDIAMGQKAWMLAVEKVNDTEGSGGPKAGVGAIRDPKDVTISTDGGVKEVDDTEGSGGPKAGAGAIRDPKDLTMSTDGGVKEPKK
jgi:alpha-tubulin suppressor-like RCC1 family protein